MKNIAPYQTYFGGKSGAGTYQTLINHIPPHKIYISPFLGNDAVFRHKKLAVKSYLSDIDPDVMEAWDGFVSPSVRPDMVCFQTANAFSILTVDFIKTLISAYMCKPNDIFIFLDPPYLFASRKCHKPVYKYEMG